MWSFVMLFALLRYAVLVAAIYGMLISSAAYIRSFWEGKVK